MGTPLTQKEIDDAAFLDAVSHSDFDQTNERLIAGQSLDALTERGETAVHLATSAMDVKMLSLLIGRGAAVDVPDKKGVRPIGDQKKSKNRARNIHPTPAFTRVCPAACPLP